MQNPLDWLEANGQPIARFSFLIRGVAVMVIGRVGVGLSEDVTRLPARLMGLAAAIMGVVLLVSPPVN
jgi:hypothetical protein